MKTRIVIYLLLGSFISCSIIGCGNKKVKDDHLIQKKTYAQIIGLNWILGSWESDSKDGLFTEKWVVKNDSVYSATSVGLGTAKDTLFVENITIEQRGNDIYYIPTVNNQNEGKPVFFKCTNCSAQETKYPTISFENPLHDFPQTITYKLIGDSLIAEVSGKVDGKNRMERFPMVRSKQR